MFLFAHTSFIWIGLYLMLLLVSLYLQGFLTVLPTVAKWVDYQRKTPAYGVMSLVLVAWLLLIVGLDLFACLGFGKYALSVKGLQSYSNESLYFVGLTAIKSIIHGS